MKYTVPIKNNYEFLRVYRKGRFSAGKFMTLYALGNNSGIIRLGITVGRKIGKSVKRNRIKRLISENFRNYEDSIARGNDLIFVARTADVMPGYRDIGREMKFHLKRIGLLNADGA